MSWPNMTVETAEAKVRAQAAIPSAAETADS